MVTPIRERSQYRRISEENRGHQSALIVTLIIGTYVIGRLG